MTEAPSLRHVQELVARLEGALAELERSDDSERAVQQLEDMAELAKEVQAEIDRARRDGTDADS